MSAARAGPGQRGIVEYMSLASNNMLMIGAQGKRRRATGNAATAPSFA
jgi:hypothetical protein